MYFLLLTCVLLAALVNYKLFDKDIMEPAVILPLVFLIGIVFGFYNYRYWRLREYGFQATACLLLGITAFGIGSFIAKLIRIIPYKRNNKVKSYGRIDLFHGIVTFSVIISIGTLFLFLTYYLRNVNANTIAGMLIEYKALRRSSKISMPIHINFMIKTTAYFSIFSLFYLLNNLITGTAKLRDYFVLINVGVYLIICFLANKRGDMLELIMAGFSAWCILYSKIRHREYKMSGEIIKKGAKVVAITLAGFAAIAAFRNGNSKDFKFVSYLCNYVSGALAAIDVYFKQGGPLNKYVGQETFPTFYNNLYAIFHIGEHIERTLEFRSYNGYDVVNIYTTFRRLFQDFGWGGVGLLSAFQGFVSTKVYRYVKFKESNRSIDFALSFYCYYFVTVIYVAMEDVFFSSDISLSGIAKSILLFLTFHVFFYKSRQSVEVIL